MQIDVIMPKMGESLQEGTILKWLKKEGDVVERDEMILEISTDKVDTEVPAPSAGVIFKLLAQENDVVEVGKVIAIIETDASLSVPQNEAAPVSKPVEVPPKPQPEAQQTTQVPVSSSGNLVDVVMPKMGESLQEGTILKWLKQSGDKVERDEMILEISTDKVDTEVPSPVGGVIAEILAAEGDTVEVGTVIAKIATGDASVAPAPQHPITSSVEQQPSPVTPSTLSASAVSSEDTYEIPRSDNKNFYSPLVRAIAKAEGISLNELQSIKGTGIEGRVTKADVMSYLNQRKSSPTAPQSTQVTSAPQKAEPAPAPQTSKPTVVALGPETEVIPMDRIRQLIAEHMVYSKRTSAHVTSVAECDVTDLVKFRDKNKNEFQKREGFKLTYTPFFAKALIDAVRQFPRVNVSVDEKNIILHKRIHLSFATALEDGNLIVPVIKNSDALSISGLARAVFDLSTRARTKKLNPDDIQGGTVTLTNVGTFGTMFGTPVINQPQCAIIGVGAIKKQPVVREFNGEDVIVIRHIMYVSITYDHRVIDGMLAGQTLSQIVKNLEAMNDKTLSL